MNPKSFDIHICFLLWKRYLYTVLFKQHCTFKMEDLLVNLRVIAVLQPYQRLHTRQVHFRIYEHRYLPEWFARWLDGATRRSDFGRIRDVYTQALENLDHPGMSEQLQNSMKGLISLKKTYENDQTMLARIDTLIETIHQSCPDD